MDPSRSRSASPSSASLCPGCGKEIDPLRAGHVAILEGGFRYFCGAECKSSYVEASSKRMSLEALTADPAAVMVTAKSGPRAKERTDASAPPPAVVFAGTAHRAESEGIVREEPHFPPSHARGAELLAERHEPAAASGRAVTEPREAEDDVTEGPPETLRSEAGDASSPRLPEDEHGAADAGAAAPQSQDAPASSLRGASRAPRAGTAVVLAHVASAAPVVGVGLGLLAVVVSLAGEASATLRLPCALAATAIFVVQALLRPREPNDLAPWFVVGPVVLAAASAVLSVAGAGARAGSHAAYVGLAAAAALLVDILVTRSRRDVSEARARIATALAVRVRVVQGEAAEEREPAEVKPGEQIVVEAGEVVGVDGLVVAGEGEVAPWFDSPVVMAKREGDAVVAGATVVSGKLRITATFTGPDRAWLRHGRPSSSREGVTAPMVALARRTAERGGPIAALLVGGATYANNAGWPDVLIAASAGAYAVAGFAAVATAGLAHARGHIAAQRRGIVYRDAEAFDIAARAEVAVVCSRGTILLGEPEIVAVEALKARGAEAAWSTTPDETSRVLSLAAGAEMASSDAFAAAILRASRARGVKPENVRSALVHSGLGVTALASNGDKVIVGSRAFLLKEKVSVAIADARAQGLEAQGRSVLLVAVGGRLVGLLALQDGLRPGARAAVQRLYDARIEPVLLSGEARDTCETIARALDIEHVRPEILPADRGAEVRALADGGRVVAAVGHPSSDDGALGAADVSVAMTAAGAAPGEWGVTLASDDVRDAALALTVPRACRERAKTAALFVAAAHGLALLGIAFGIAPPAVAPIAAVIAAATALTMVREPTTLRPPR